MKEKSKKKSITNRKSEDSTELPYHVVERIVSKEQAVNAISKLRNTRLKNSSDLNSQAVPSYTDNLALNWGHSFLKTTSLWSYENGSLLGTGVKVAVLDTGIDPTHPDFSGAIELGRDFSGTGSWADGHGHGSHCAGIIGARMNYGSCVGIAPECRLIIGKVLGNDGGGSFTAVSNGVRWAADSGANVISMSLGAQTSMPTSLKSAIDYAISKNVIVVVAAGNEGRTGVGAPGSYTKCVTIGACKDSSGAIASFSSIGSAVDVVAPGVNIFSTYKDRTYASMSGTSMATPFVAGIAALFVQVCRVINITPTQALFETYVQRTAIDRGIRGKDNTYGFGCIAPVAIIDNLYKYKSRPPTTLSFAFTSRESSSILNFDTKCIHPDDIFSLSTSLPETPQPSSSHNLPFSLNKIHPSGLFVKDDEETNLKIFKVKGVDDDVIFMRVLKGLISNTEIAEIINLGKGKLSPSLVRKDNGKHEKDTRRTSQTGVFERSETPLIEEIEKRVTSLFDLPSSFLEPIQILKYSAGEKYDPHYDAIHDFSTFENLENFEKGFQRIISVFVYLNDVPTCPEHQKRISSTSYDENGLPIAGKFRNGVCGSTHFKNLNLSFSCKKGDAVVWTNTDASRNVLKESLHEGTPLCSGEKWALNFWIHGRDAPPM